MEHYWKRFSLIAFLALLLSGYLLFHYTEVTGGFQQEKSFCSISATLDCDTVAQSSYAQFAGLPVAGWGLVYYLLYLVLIYVLTRDLEQGSKGPGAGKAADTLLFFSALALVPSFWLLWVSHFYLGKYCLMCCALDVAIVLLFGLAYFCPARTGSFLGSLVAGAKNFISMSFDYSRGKGLSSGLLLSIVLVVGVALALILPEALASNYFRPRHRSYENLDHLKPFLDAWKDARVVEVPVREGTALEKDFAIGNPNAKVKIIEFSDFECPYCKRTAATLKPFISANLKDFYFVFKNYPLDQGCNSRIDKPKHLYACLAAAVTRCAGQQSDELFWKAHDAIMGASDFDGDELLSIVEAEKVNVTELSACLADPAIKARIVQDTELGNELRVVSTPTIYINGKKVQIGPAYLPGLLKLILAEVSK